MSQNLIAKEDVRTQQFRIPPKYRPEAYHEFPILPTFVRGSTGNYSIIGVNQFIDEWQASLIVYDSPPSKWAHWNGIKLRGGLFHPKDFHLAETCDGARGKAGCRYRIRLRSIIRKRERMNMRDNSARMSPTIMNPDGGPYHEFLRALINGNSLYADLLLAAWDTREIDSPKK